MPQLFLIVCVFPITYPIWCKDSENIRNGKEINRYFSFGCCYYMQTEMREQIIYLSCLSPKTFALTDAKLCVGKCKALRWRLQSFALADAMLCVWDGQKLGDLFNTCQYTNKRWYRLALHGSDSMSVTIRESMFGTTVTQERDLLSPKTVHYVVVDTVTSPGCISMSCVPAVRACCVFLSVFWTFVFSAS